VTAGLLKEGEQETIQGESANPVTATQTKPKSKPIKNEEGGNRGMGANRWEGGNDLWKKTKGKGDSALRPITDEEVGGWADEKTQRQW